MGTRTIEHWIGRSVSRRSILAQAKLILGFCSLPLVEDAQTTTTRFAYQIRDRGEFVVEIVRRRNGGQYVGEVRLIDRDVPERRKSIPDIAHHPVERRFSKQALDLPASSRTRDGLLRRQTHGRRLRREGTRS